MVATRSSWIVGVFAVALAECVARADTLEATLGQPLAEVTHDVQITVARGVASYRVQRVFANRGTVADEASLDIDLPFGGGVTGLRIRARDTWYDGDLMEAAAAANLYEELTGFGPFPAKDPALLQWVWPDKVHLQLFPVLPGRTSTVEYTITVPTSYHDGRYHLSYPRFPGPGLVPPVFVLRPVPGEASAAASFDGQPVAPGQSFHLPPPATEPPWDGGVSRAPGGSYVFSPVVVPDSERARGAIRSATVAIDLVHTYRGDLRVELVTPQGRSVTIHDRAGSGENDLRARIPLALPPGTTAAGRWRLVISDHAARDVGTLQRWSLTVDTGRGAPVVAEATSPLFVPDAPEGDGDRGLVAIAIAAPPIDTVAARLGRVIASPAHGFLRLDLDAAPELRPLPRDASVVFVVDASHSVGEEGIARQIALARAYLAHVPDARFEVVLFRRFAARLAGAFAPAASFDPRIAAASRERRLAPGNGSALDLGLDAALAALRGRSGPKRVVLFSDAELRSSFPAAQTRALAILARLPGETVVHVVLPEGGGSDEAAARRDDDHPLAPIACAGHGLLAHLDVGTTDPVKLRAAVLGLVRPIRIDRFRVDAAVFEGTGIPSELDEGASVRAMVALDAPPARVAVDGLIWSEPFHRVVEVSAPFSKATAAFVFSEDRHGALDPREMMAVAMLGQVVSPVTSYLAAEPGVRPSPIGLRRLTGRGSGFGSGAGGLGGIGMGAGGGGRPELRPLVAPGIDRCVAMHHPAPDWAVVLDVETTRDEIVDVAVTRGADLAIAPCLVEAAWSVRLHPTFAAFARERFTLDLGGH
ncbi:MAG: VWA domain-containing protein [Myxococcales bacterium]|nr:VWA domain-containing protein [Myxococcales bacterium]